MSEYKGKLLSGLFTKAKNVITSNGKDVDSLLTWKNLSSNQGTITINFPASWDEISVSAMIVVGSSACVGMITKEQLDDIITASVYNSAYVTIGGGYQDATSFYQLIALVTATQMTLTLYSSGVNISENTQFDVKYR